MAITAQLPSQTNSTRRGTDNIHEHVRESLESMNDTMSYQYPPPPPPHDASDVGLPHSSYLSSNPTPSTPSMVQVPRLAPRFSVQKPQIEKVPVNSNVRPQGTNDSEHGHLGLSGEKRQNKLGYRRINIACGNCRKRKIRCMPQDGDEHRCQQCIRLKKECSFHPVDQPQPAVMGQRAGVRSPVGPKIESASSSPVISPGQPADLQSHPPYTQLATMPSMQNMGPPSMKHPDSYPADSKSPRSLLRLILKHSNVPASASSIRTIDYGHGVSNWIPPDTSPSSAKAPGGMNVSWRAYQHEPPAIPAFSPYTPHAPHSSTSWSTAPLGNPSVEASSRPEDSAWSSYPGPPVRSLSYSGEPSQTYATTNQAGSAHSSRTYDRRSSMVSNLYPSPITTTIPTVESIPGTAIDPQESLSAGSVPNPSYGTWQQPYQYPKSSEGYEGWYASTGHSEPHVSSGTDQSSSNLYYSSR
ncbi:hypothetical protein BJ170DRAFT_597003 [Xylariales sp. AK1849]|nr:hypothetical protein BJ170DRAFT_597003 [Xylariales sp. AK1849]